MTRELIEILVLAAIAGFVVFRLYSVLGRRTGSERPSAPPPQARPAPVEAGPSKPQPAPLSPPAQPAPAFGGLGDVERADPSFDATHFLTGAKSAYEYIVSAFASGDRATLQGLLTPRVFAVYEKALDDRAASGGAGPELVRLKSAEIVDGAVQGDIARVAVRFEAELAEGVAGIRETRERWTFERNVTDRNPNWLLAAVAQA